MATYPLATLACTIDANGITAPSYNDIYSSLQASFYQIYGSDAYITPDSQDGQLLAIFAQAMHDANQATIMAYNNFSPATAVGVGLSSVVKINDISRAVASASQVDVTLTGVAGTIINNGVVGDTLGNKWNLPGYVLIPPAGTVTVTATSQALGAIPATVGSITKILTPVTNWQTVTNADSASLGEPVESDGQLRSRQAVSPALNSKTVAQGIEAALLAIPGVTYLKLYENDTNTTDSNGLPAHSIGVVIEGGDATTIANTILVTKGVGVATYGTTTVAVPDISGAMRNINFSRPTLVPIKAEVWLTAGSGYTSVIGAELTQAIADYINNDLSVGDDVIVIRLYVPAMLDGAADSLTYKVTALQAALVTGSLGTTDIVIAFNAKATCNTADILLTVS